MPSGKNSQTVHTQLTQATNTYKCNYWYPSMVDNDTVSKKLVKTAKSNCK